MCNVLGNVSLIDPLVLSVGVALTPIPSRHYSCPLSPLVRIWDIRPFAPNDRQLKIFRGNRHSFEKVGDLSYMKG